MKRRPVRRGDQTGEPLLHILMKVLVAGQLRGLGPTPSPIGVPLRGRRSVLQLATSSRRVAP
jgi:hypothetical protein